MGRTRKLYGPSNFALFNFGKSQSFHLSPRLLPLTSRVHVAAFPWPLAVGKEGSICCSHRCYSSAAAFPMIPSALHLPKFAYLFEGGLPSHKDEKLDRRQNAEAVYRCLQESVLGQGIRTQTFSPHLSRSTFVHPKLRHWRPIQ